MANRKSIKWMKLEGKEIKEIEYFKTRTDFTRGKNFKKNLNMGIMNKNILYPMFAIFTNLKSKEDFDRTILKEETTYYWVLYCKGKKETDRKRIQKVEEMEGFTRWCTDEETKEKLKENYNGNV